MKIKCRIQWCQSWTAADFNSQLCWAHSAEWNDSGEATRVEEMYHEMPYSPDVSKSILERSDVAFMDFVNRIEKEGA